MNVEIREERPEDIAAIRELNRNAFGRDQEANIVDALRASGNTLLSLVATLNGQVVGHILYSPISIAGSAWGAALGPMAVSPEYQRQEIGSKLVEAGNLRIKGAGHPFIIVLGHAHYYPQFGFVLASSHGVRCEWEVPDDVFMLLILDQSRMKGVSGQAKYRNEFSAVL
jgi:putative acetyltransferase